jgi:hypothetical protein
MPRRLLLIALLAAAAFAAPRAAWAQTCSGCRAAIEASAEGRIYGASLNSGVLMLMAAPYTLLAAIGFAAYRAYRKNRKSSEQD